MPCTSLIELGVRVRCHDVGRVMTHHALLGAHRIAVVHLSEAAVAVLARQVAHQLRDRGCRIVGHHVRPHAGIGGADDAEGVTRVGRVRGHGVGNRDRVVATGTARNGDRRQRRVDVSLEHRHPVQPDGAVDRIEVGRVDAVDLHIVGDDEVRAARRDYDVGDGRHTGNGMRHLGAGDASVVVADRAALDRVLRSGRARRPCGTNRAGRADRAGRAWRAGRACCSILTVVAATTGEADRRSERKHRNQWHTRSRNAVGACKFHD